KTAYEIFTRLEFRRVLFRSKVSSLQRERGEVWLAAARALDATGDKPRGAERPMPRPPAEVRPRKLSVTEIETLFRSPYDLYAKQIGRASCRERGEVHEDAGW